VPEHGIVALRIAMLLVRHVEAAQLGIVFASARSGFSSPPIPTPSERPTLPRAGAFFA